MDSLLTALKPATAVGREWLRTRLSSPTSDASILQSRQETIRAVKKLLSSALLEQRAVLAKTEASVQSLAEAVEDEDAEYYNQLLWSSDSVVATVNTWGWLTELIVAFRSFILPAFSALMPIMLFLAPVIAILMSGETMTVARYTSLLQAAIQKTMPTSVGTRFTSPLMSFAEQIVSVGASLIMLIATAWTQVSTGRAVHRVATNMRAHATSVQTSEQAVQILVRIMRAGGVQLEEKESPGPWSNSTLSAFGEAWNSSARVRAQLAQIGEIDGLMALASAKRTCFPTFSDSFAMTDFWHPELRRSRFRSRVYNSIDLKKRPHVLLTGPNRGGKTTVLKSLGVAVLMAQSVGIVFARRATLPLFGAIRTSLRPVDTLGARSLFETEIDFACEIQTIKAPLFLIMDEIFHGTNALDGVAAAEVFMERLYANKTSVVSIISTHYSELPTRFGTNDSVQTLCMDAHVDPTDPDRIVSSYRIRKGINKVSSVREILRERGLLSH